MKAKSTVFWIVTIPIDDKKSSPVANAMEVHDMTTMQMSSRGLKNRQGVPQTY
jgi:hypothetical protein